MTATFLSSFRILAPFSSRATSTTEVDSPCGGRELLKSPNLLSIRPNTEAELDPITDVFRTLHVTAFGQHRLEATAPWGLRGGGAENEEKVPNASKTTSPTDFAHFAMLSRGNCWLNVEGIAEPIPLTGGDCMLLGHDTSIVMRDSPRTRPRSTFREIAAKANDNGAHHERVKSDIYSGVECGVSPLFMQI